jgi:hypothetical protein
MTPVIAGGKYYFYNKDNPNSIDRFFKNLEGKVEYFDTTLNIIKLRLTYTPYMGFGLLYWIGNFEEFRYNWNLDE